MELGKKSFALISWWVYASLCVVELVLRNLLGND